jgi:hypothetical protein
MGQVTYEITVWLGEERCSSTSYFRVRRVQGFWPSNHLEISENARVPQIIQVMDDHDFG